jgi:GntR family transcriptional regulator / MocR family aminotransferase
MPKIWASTGLELHLDLNPTLGRRAALGHALREAIRSAATVRALCAALRALLPPACRSSTPSPPD